MFRPRPGGRRSGQWAPLPPFGIRIRAGERNEVGGAGWAVIAGGLIARGQCRYQIGNGGSGRQPTAPRTISHHDRRG